ncbi:MAG: hypothetical protein IT289_12205 [Oligoflexia bacterium]|nr:hypothetical protein [Oligoflexia bacterium]
MLRRMTFVFALVLAIANCGPKSPRLVNPVEKPVPFQLDDQVIEIPGDAKVDIVFVMDNSKSMLPHMVNLQNNIDRFVGAFAKNSMIDYHIGVLAIYDSKQPREKNPSFDVFPLGQLLPLTDPSVAAPAWNPEHPNKPRKVLEGPRFVTRQTVKMQKTLGDTINIGWWHGPEYEELFSPVLAAISPENQTGANAGFFRSDAYLVVIMVTDADDDSEGISPEQLYYKLLDFKGNEREKVMGFAVVSPVEEKTCKKDPSIKNGGGPFRILKFVELTDGYSDSFSLCSPEFGKKLTNLGDTINQRVGRKVIKLPYKPDFKNRIEIKYGTQLRVIDLQQGQFPKGWQYDADANALIVDSNHDFKMEPGANFSIKLLPVKLINVKNGKTERI